MIPDRWRKIEEVFQAAAEHPEADREAFLNEACADDTELRIEVASLLSHAGADGFIQSVVAGGTSLLEHHEHESIIGSHIGIYRVTGLIGHGGMGTVYAAVRDDDQYHQQVAKPSSVVTSAKLRRQLAGDLDNIVLMSLRQYESPTIRRSRRDCTTHQNLWS